MTQTRPLPAVVKIVRKAFWRDPAWLRILYGTRQDFHGFLSLTSEHTQDRGHYGYFGFKNAQLRSKTASSSTTLKVEVFLEGGKTA